MNTKSSKSYILSIILSRGEKRLTITTQPTLYAVVPNFLCKQQYNRYKFAYSFYVKSRFFLLEKFDITIVVVRLHDQH